MPKWPVQVVTRNLVDPDESPRLKEIDYLSRSDRQWLSSHCLWAMDHFHSVITIPQTRKPI